MWVIGSNKETGGYGIYRRDGTKWTKIGGSAVRITVDGAGNAWVVNIHGQIFEYTGKTWINKPGAAIDISSDGNDIAVMGTDQSPYRYYCLGAVCQWKKTTGKAMHIDVGKNGVLYVVTSAGGIFK